MGKRDRGLYATGHGLDRLPYNKEVLAGLVIGIPALWVLKAVPTSKFDMDMGNLSYGVFLNHFFLIWLLDGMGVPTHGGTNVVYLIALSLTLAWLSYIGVEVPTRRYFRSFVASPLTLSRKNHTIKAVPLR